MDRDRSEGSMKNIKGRVKEGHILVSVHSDNADETRRAREIFERNGAEDISSASEEGVSDRDRDRDINRPVGGTTYGSSTNYGGTGTGGTTSKY